MKRSLAAAFNYVLVISLLVPLYSVAQEEDDDEKPVTSSGPSVRGSAGTEFAQVPVHYLKNCSNSILYGTSARYKNSVFVVPRPIMGIDANGESLVRIQPAGEDTYNLKVGLFFQIGKEGDDHRKDSNSNLMTNNCNIEEVISEYNRDKPKADRLLTPAPLMITKIIANIQGESEKVMIGTDSTGMIEYRGTDLFLTFPIKSKDKLDMISASMTDGMGLPIDLEIFFAASAQDGSVEIKIDYSAIANAIQANGGSKDMIKQVDLAAVIKSAVQKSNTDVSMQTSSDGTFNEMAMNLVKEIIEGLPDSSTASSDDDDNWNNDDDSDNNSRWNNDDSDEDSRRSTRGPKIRVFKVSAVVKHLRTKQSKTIKISNQSKVQNHSYATQTKLWARSMQPGVAEPKLKAGEGKKYFNTSVTKGTVIKLILNSVYNEKYAYATDERFFHSV